MGILDSTQPKPAISLRESIALLGEEEIVALAVRLRVALDDDKRISFAEQLCRALSTRRRIRRADGFTPDVQALFIEALAHNGHLAGAQSGVAWQELQDAAWVLPVPGSRGAWAVPAAYLMQLPYVEGEDRRGVRSLLRVAAEPDLAAMVRHFDPRSTGSVSPLFLEVPYILLSQPAGVRSLLAELGPAEAQLLQAIVELGGEVSGDELSDLLRNPMRIALAGAVAAPRAATGAELSRRGLLFSVPPDRHIMPLEVLEVVTAKQRRVLAIARAKVRKDLAKAPPEVSRAEYGKDCGPLLAALALLRREKKASRPGVGIPKTLLKQLAVRVGKSPEEVALLGTLSRQLGLWDGPGEPPFRLGDLGRLAFETWCTTPNWDEGRVEAEVLRSPKAARMPSPYVRFRHVVLDVVQALANDAWVPSAVLTDNIVAEADIAGLPAQLVRHHKRSDVPLVEPQAFATRVLLETLPSLGCVDLGIEQGGGGPPLVKLNALGQRWLDPSQRAQKLPVAEFTQSTALRAFSGATLSQLLAVQPYVEVGQIGDEFLELLVSQQGLSAAAEHGESAEQIQARFAELCPVTEEFQRLLTRAFAYDESAELVACSGFLWVDDPELLRKLRSSKGLAPLFVHPSPSGGLLIAPGVSEERLSRRLRKLGVQVQQDESGSRLR